MSETASMANSQISTYSGNTKASGHSGAVKKRPLGRPRKHDRQSLQSGRNDVGASRDNLNDAASTSHTSIPDGFGRGGRRSVISGRSGDADGEDDEDDEAEEAPQLGGEQDKELQKREEALENERRIRLEQAFTPDQQERFVAFRAVKMKGGVLRRIVNQTVSQSVGPLPLHAINIYTKAFTGEIIEHARRVQEEWAEAYEDSIEVNKEETRSEIERLKQDIAQATEQPTGTRFVGNEKVLCERKIKGLEDSLGKYTPNPHRGLLMPDHLREGLRRYKADGDGGGVGFGGQSHALLGVKGSVSWRVGQGSGARRLFR